MGSFVKRANTPADPFRGLSVHLLQSQPEQMIQQLLVFLDGKVGQLGQFMVAQNKMHPVRKFILQGGHVFENRVRHAPAVLYIQRSAVAHFLQHQVPPGILVQGRDFFYQIEIPPVPVQIARNHRLVARLFRDNTMFPTLEGVCRFASVARANMPTTSSMY